MYRMAERLSTLFARIAGFAVLGCVVIITVEVLIRKTFNISIVGADEISGYVLAISVTWGASLALIRRAHVRIDVVQARMPARVRAAFDLLALFSMLLLSVFFAWYATNLLRTNIRTGAISNTHMEIPLWIPQSLWVAGFWVFAAVILIVIPATVRALMGRDSSAAHRIAGVRGAMEEAAEEMSETGARR
ncbi:MAG: TRAP transporter small permease [Alphaproteobacteria bacterium]|nr:TRAP transporter small permease [Alphaproteobacteria bacterium]